MVLGGLNSRLTMKKLSGEGSWATQMVLVGGTRDSAYKLKQKVQTRCKKNH